MKFFMLLLFPIFVLGQQIEGIYSNFSILTKLEYFNENNIEINYSSFYDEIKFNDELTDNILTQLSVKSENKKLSNKTDTLLNLLYKGIYNKILKYDTDNFVDDYIKLIAAQKAESLFLSESIIKKIRKYKNEKIDSLMNIVIAANLLKNKQYNEAYNLIKKYKDPYSLYIKGVHYLENNDKQTSLKILLDINSEQIHESSYLLVSQIYIDNKEYNNALYYVNLFEDNFKQSVNYYNGKYLKGLIYYHKGYFKKSIEILKEITYKSKNSIVKGNSYYLIGKNYFMLGEYDEMEKYLAYVKNPQIKSDYKKNALFLDAKGMFFNKNYKKAIEKFNLFLNSYPDDFLSPYAYQLLAESYFYNNEFEKSREFIKKVKQPVFLYKKLVHMKYFISYKNGEYTDSIEAYLDFLKKEKDNPLRNEIYDYIFLNSHNDSLKTNLLKMYMFEFKEDEKTIVYLKQLIPYLVFNNIENEIYFFSDNIRKNFPSQKDEIFSAFINKMLELKMDKNVIGYYTKYAEFFKNEYPDIIFSVAKILIKEKNYEGGELLLKNIIANFNSEYSDSSCILLSKLYLEHNEYKKLEKFYNEIKEKKDPTIEAYIQYDLAIYYRENNEYEKAINLFILSAEQFGEQRNKAALSLLEAGKTAFSNNDIEYANLLLDKANVLATDINILNKIKVEYEKINKKY